MLDQNTKLFALLMGTSIALYPSDAQALINVNEATEFTGSVELQTVDYLQESFRDPKDGGCHEPFVSLLAPNGGCGNGGCGSGGGNGGCSGGSGNGGCSGGSGNSGCR